MKKNCNNCDGDVDEEVNDLIDKRFQEIEYDNCDKSMLVVYESNATPFRKDKNKRQGEDAVNIVKEVVYLNSKYKTEDEFQYQKSKRSNKRSNELVQNKKAVVSETIVTENRFKPLSVDANLDQANVATAQPKIPPSC